MRDEIFLERGKGIGLATFHGTEGADTQRIMKDRQKTQTAPDKFLIRAQGFHVGIRGLCTGGFHMNIEGAPDAVLRHPEQMSNGRHRQLLGQGQDQGIHQQREATPRNPT